jgi:hypothetical protein
MGICGDFSWVLCQKRPIHLGIEALASYPSSSKMFLQKESPFSIVFNRGRFGPFWGNLGLHFCN